MARWNDSRQSPAIVEKRIGEGRVLLWTITADKKWSDWPTDGSYVLAVRQAAMAIAAHSTERDNVTAGQPLRFRLDKKGIPLQAGVKPPGREDPQVVAVDKSDPKFPQLRYDKTARAGFYRMEWKDPVLGSMSRLFAASPDVRESNLAPISRDESEEPGRQTQSADRPPGREKSRRQRSRHGAVANGHLGTSGSGRGRKLPGGLGGQGVAVNPQKSARNEPAAHTKHFGEPLKNRRR